MSVNMSGSGAVGLGVGVGSYQLGVYVPLKALFLVIINFYISVLAFHIECLKVSLLYAMDELVFNKGKW